jgi:hypothetical protein
VSGAVNPGSLPATYTFELGVYNGASTQYGVVLSAPVGTSSTPVAETLGLSGLQPGTAYAYRIAIHSGYGESVGAPVTFTTAGVPLAIVPPALTTMLSLPKITFPKAGKSHPRRACKAGYVRDKRGHCVKRKQSARSRKGAGKRKK